MPVVFVLNGQIGPTPLNILSFIRGAQAHPAGPQPGRLPSGITTVSLTYSQTGMQFIREAPSKTVVVGLISCAAVLYVSTDRHAVPGVWLHHANAGHVSGENVQSAIHNLGSRPAASIYVIFAHPDPSDNGYNASMATIAEHGINDHNIIEIPNVIVPQFGVDNLGQIGF
jgi:hypothetical protein